MSLCACATAWMRSGSPRTSPMMCLFDQVWGAASGVQLCAVLCMLCSALHAVKSVALSVLWVSSDLASVVLNCSGLKGCAWAGAILQFYMPDASQFHHPHNLQSVIEPSHLSIMQAASMANYPPDTGRFCSRESLGRGKWSHSSAYVPVLCTGLMYCSHPVISHHQLTTVEVKATGCCLGVHHRRVITVVPMHGN